MLSSRAFFLCPKKQGGGIVLFTEGKHKQYERMMQEKPGFERRDNIGRTSKKDMTIQFATADNKDCPYCLYYDGKRKRCSMDSCSVFDE